jgi:hypothetical protein
MVARRMLRRIGYGIEALATQTFAKATRCIWMNDGETAEEAIARFRAEHPDADRYELLVMGWLPTGSADPPSAAEARQVRD